MIGLIELFCNCKPVKSGGRFYVRKDCECLPVFLHKKYEMDPKRLRKLFCSLGHFMLFLVCISLAIFACYNYSRREQNTSTGLLCVVCGVPTFVRKDGN